jgi:putative ABC transport system permease protein
LPPLLQLRRVPPARVLRHDLEPPPLRYGVVYGAAIAAILAIIVWLVRDLELVGYVTIGTAVTFAALYGAGAVLVRALSRLRGGVGVAWRYGLANVARRGRDSIVQVVAFGLGLMVLLLLALVRNDLLDDWRASLPADAPNHFMINIRPDETDAFQSFFAARQLPAPELVPMVRGRLIAINGVPATDREFATDRARNFIEREANLTWAAQLGRGNEIVAGRWWHEGDAGGPRVSVEQEIALALGLELGDLLTYDVAGETIAAQVSSFRTVAWDTFEPNFFMVLSPGVLDAATGTFITSVHLAGESRRLLVDLVREFPEVTVIDIDAMLGQVRDVMDKASIAVQYVFLFTLLAGITVLLAAIQATRDERRYESAMLRTLGASRRTVLQGVAAEFTALGLLAGTLAATGATIAAYFLATRLFDLDYDFAAGPWIAGLVGGALLVGTSGTLATRSVVNHPPIATLRDG